MAWPASDASGVPTDATLVFYLAYGERELELANIADAIAGGDAGVKDSTTSDAAADAQLPDAGYVLRDDAGTPTLLESVRVIEGENVCTTGLQIIRPQRSLEPQTHYSLYKDGVLRESFTTGAGPRDPKADADAASRLEYLVASAFGSGLVTAVFVQGLGDDPLLLRATGTNPLAYFAQRHAANQVPLQLEAGRSECVQLEVIGLDGGLLEEREFCEPDRCYDATEASVDSCGGVYDGLSWDTFSMLPETGTCATLPPDEPVPSPPGGSSSEPLPDSDDKPTGSTSDSDNDDQTSDSDNDDQTSDSDNDDQGVSTRAVDDEPQSGCSLTQRASAEEQPSATWLLALSALAFRSRRRTARS